MRKILIAFLVILSCSSLVAKTTSYDIGGGQTLLLNEDGSYEIIATDIDTSAFVGKQYTLDIMRTFDPLITLAMMDDPSAALLGKEFYYSLLEESGVLNSIMSQIPNVSIIFLNETTVFLSFEGEGQRETSYRVASNNDLFLMRDDGFEQKLGTFSDDYSEICLLVEDSSLPFYLVRQE